MNQTTHPRFADSHTQKAYWLDAYGPYTPNAPLRGEITVDVAIIGGGYSGLATAIGMVGDPRAWYSLGCVGHGVAPAHLNGQTLADLVLERQTDLAAVWFVNRRPIPWPPEPLRWMASQALLGYLHAEDWWHERGMS